MPPAPANECGNVLILTRQAHPLLHQRGARRLRRRPCAQAARHCEQPLRYRRNHNTTATTTAAFLSSRRQQSLRLSTLHQPALASATTWCGLHGDAPRASAINPHYEHHHHSNLNHLALIASCHTGPFQLLASAAQTTPSATMELQAQLGGSAAASAAMDLSGLNLGGSGATAPSAAMPLQPTPTPMLAPLQAVPLQKPSRRPSRLLQESAQKRGRTMDLSTRICSPPG